MRTNQSLVVIAALMVAGFTFHSFSVLPAEAQERDKRMVREATDKLKLALTMPRRASAYRWPQPAAAGPPSDLSLPPPFCLPKFL